jgi:hypothetical protein
MYRGAAPIQHAIMRGDEQTGVCVIGMQERKMGIDAGPIWNMKRDVGGSLAPFLRFVNLNPLILLYRLSHPTRLSPNYVIVLLNRAGNS